MAGHYINTVEDQVTGKPVNGATILVYEDGATISADGLSVTSGTLATIFSDDGITQIDQSASPITTGSNGRFNFYTNLARVVIAILVGGEGRQTCNDVDIVTGDAGDVTTLAIRVDNHDALLGQLANATDLGAFTGTTIPDNSDVTEALQALETQVETEAARIDALNNYIFGFFFTTTPTVSEVLLRHTAGAGFTIPADFSGGLQSNVGTNPTASFALDVQRNGASIGTITVSTVGAVTAVTTGNAAQAVALGDEITVVAPDPADATAADMSFTFIGAR